MKGNDNYRRLCGAFAPPTEYEYDEDYHTWLDSLDTNDFLTMMDISLDGTFTPNEMKVITSLLQSNSAVQNALELNDKRIDWRDLRARVHGASLEWLGGHEVSRGILLDKLEQIA